MSTNDFVPYATAGGANVESQVAYVADSTRSSGATTGTASSALSNKAWRQATTWAAALGQFITSTLSQDCLDDGNITTKVSQLVAAIQASLSLPVGMVVASAVAAAPTGWLICNGQAISRTTYAALFALLGTAYGAGDGSTTFNVPDYRGLFLRGLDAGRGLNPVTQNLGQVLLDSVVSHNHVITFYGDNSGNSGPGHGGGTPSTENTTSVGAQETRPKNITVVYIIKT